MVELYLHFPKCPHGILVNYIIEKDNIASTVLWDVTPCSLIVKYLAPQETGNRALVSAVQ
jgi:hypothetical protein